jgi:hypothetical protein
MIFVNSLRIIVGARWGYNGDYTFYIFKKIIRLGFAFFERRMKVDYVIRENKGEDDNSPLVELNSKFEFASMQWIPKVVECSKID